VSDPFERKRRLRQWLDRQTQQEERVVVPGRAIQVEDVTSRAPVDEDPLPVSAHCDGDGLHERAAIGGSVARAVIVEMTAPETVRAVVPVGGAQGVDRDIQATVAASERVWAMAPGAMALMA
jgi:hypothetical protein